MVTVAGEGPVAGEAAVRWWTILALVVAGGGVALSLVHYFAGDPDDPEGWLASAAFGAPIVVAGVLALLGVWRGHPVLVVAASTALFPVALVSVVMWPILLPVGFLLAHGLPLIDRPSVRDAAVGVLVAAGLIVAFFALLVHQDPVTWQSPDGTRSGGSSDIITTAEALISLAISGTAGGIAVAAVLLPSRRP